MQSPYSYQQQQQHQPYQYQQQYQQQPRQQQQQQQYYSQYGGGAGGNSLAGGNVGGGMTTATASSNVNHANYNRHRLMRPPFVDPETNIIYDTDNAEYEGWLTKQSAWLKEWRRRYFILKGSKLFFAKNEYSSPHGMMDLAHCTTVKSADLKSKKRHSFEISTPETCYLLYADSESEKDDWIGRVGKAIVRCSRTYYQQGSGDGLGSSSSAGGGGAVGGAGRGGGGGLYQVNDDVDDDDDIYTNDDPNNPYYND